jgi:hypothetical protein
MHKIILTILLIVFIASTAWAIKMGAINNSVLGFGKLGMGIYQPTSEPEPGTGDSILFEDGDNLIFEDGNNVIFEN